MKRAEYQVEFVTPCFLGGADPSSAAEWRAASIRGQLRWWHRAILWVLAGYDLQKVAKAEAKTWGNTALQSRLRIRCGQLPPDAIETSHVEFERTSTGSGRNTKNGPAYLGYGPIRREERRFRNLRPFIKPEKKTFFFIEARSGVVDNELSLAVQAWACFGGIGARSRRGFGSLLISKNGNYFDVKNSVASIQKALNIHFRTWRSADFTKFPPYSAFSNATRVLVWATPQKDWANAMQQVGESLITFRRRYRTSTGSAPDRDYAWAYDPHDEAEIPDRIGFGLPLAFGVKEDSSHKKKVILEGQHHERRASPFLIHIAKELDGYRPVLLYMPAAFLPNSEQIVYKGDSGKGHSGAVEERHYAIIENYLDDLWNKKIAEEVQ